jgi:hypothetical protein
VSELGGGEGGGGAGGVGDDEDAPVVVELTAEQLAAVGLG